MATQFDVWWKTCGGDVGAPANVAAVEDAHAGGYRRRGGDPFNQRGVAHPPRRRAERRPRPRFATGRVTCGGPTGRDVGAEEDVTAVERGGDGEQRQGRTREVAANTAKVEVEAVFAVAMNERFVEV